MSSVGNSTLPVKIAFFDIDGTLLPLGLREPSAKIVYTLKEFTKKWSYSLYGHRKKRSGCGRRRVHAV